MAEANCGANWFFGDYSIRGNAIQLEYVAIEPRALLCTCSYPVTYLIRGLDRKDYRAELTALPAVWTGWMPLSMVAGTLLILLLIAVAYGISVLVARRSGGSRATGLLVILLAFSAIANMLLWYVAGSSLFGAEARESVNSGVLRSLGRNAGHADADRDFAAGKPRWLVMEASESIAARPPGRTYMVLEGVDWAGESYRKAYVDAYNYRMDRHLPPPPRSGPPSKK